MSTAIRRIALILMLVMLIGSSIYFVRAESVNCAFGLDSCAEAMAMIDLDSGRLLAEKNSDRRLPMASTTKIMTAITVIENVRDLDEVISIPDIAVGVEGSSIYLKKGEKISVRDLLYGLMLRSGNDCAVALAVKTGGSIAGFADMMNALAKAIGATDTHFVNPHGLHDDDHFTTAYDLSLISAYAMKNSEFAEIVGTKTHRSEGENARVMVNKNKILSTFDGGCGIKTGFTKRAGRCLVSSAQRDGRTIICTVLNCGPMFEECSRLMNYAFDNLIMSDIISASTPISKIRVTNGKEKYVYVGLESVTPYPLTVDEAKRLTFEFDLPDEVPAPVKKGERMGKVSIYLNNRLLFSEDLFIMNNVEEISFWDRLRDL